MRTFILTAAAAAATLVSVFGVPVKAEVYYPWCARYGWTTYNCGFVSQRQCLATVVGAGGICEPNPAPRPPSAKRGKRMSEGPVYGPAYGGRMPVARAGEPARMVQLPNGRWISSYGCVMDEGNGVFKDCGNDRDH